ncbi:hypothetical protein LTR97_011311 [Elasticomyces elasticus]|uniref:Heterokaryon incompatibility domain-containing protein n=1 Tax=Elasticomyces elasticus TaxID=574655 RepID=A0AAN7VT75_9PEZI|nr:hypothetical protein LTR97_011311 [Elasticomyces elasticus]
MAQPQSWPLRLIDVRTLQLQRVHDEAPPYAILSHTWDEDEILLQEWESGGAAMTLKKGYLKVVNACKKAEHDGFDWLWADTCCIDKMNNSELAESIQRMYAWYQNAEVCYAFLSDVDGGQALADDADSTHDKPVERVEQFRRSKYFTRAWDITGNHRLSDCTFAQRLSWASARQTKRIEDQAYSLLGILEVFMPAHYDEGPNAFMRLQKVLLSEEGGLTVLAWELNDIIQSASLLAPSIAYFQDCGDIEPELSSRSTAEYSFTNLGLSGHFPVTLKPTPVGGYVFTTLHCYRKSKPHEILALRLDGLHTPSGSDRVECYTSSGSKSATRVGTIHTHQQAVMMEITIRFLSADYPRAISVHDLHQLGEYPESNATSENWTESTDSRQATLQARQPFVGGIDPVGGDLYRAIDHSTVAFIGAGMGLTADPHQFARDFSTGSCPMPELSGLVSSNPGNDCSAAVSALVLDDNTNNINGKDVPDHVKTAPTAYSNLPDSRSPNSDMQMDDDHRKSVLVTNPIQSPMGSTETQVPIIIVTETNSTVTPAVQNSATGGTTRRGVGMVKGNANATAASRPLYDTEEEESLHRKFRLRKPDFFRVGPDTVLVASANQASRNLIICAPQAMPPEVPSHSENGMRAAAIRVNAENPEHIDPRSRLDYGKVHTVHHNIKVAEVGVVHPASLDDLLRQFEDVWLGLSTTRSSTATSIASVLHSDCQWVDMVRHMMRLLTQRGRSHAQAVNDVTERLAAAGCDKVSIMQWIVASLLPQDAAASVLYETLSEGDSSDDSDGDGGCRVNI